MEDLYLAEKYEAKIYEDKPPVKTAQTCAVS
jgi:hypothetical protein